MTDDESVQMTSRASAQSPASPRPRRARNMRVEMLRVAAILGIAVFHTSQPWFTVVATSTPVDRLPAELQPVAANPAAMWVLGMTALLGACGNHIFYMISGFYLIPSAAAKPLRAQAAATARRAAIIVLSVLFYVAVCAVIDLFTPVAGFGTAGWWGMGLEFVWLYLVFVVVAPAAAWLFARMDARTRHALAALALVAVFALNAYIAFVAPEGGRGLTDWRKLMSAVTYLATFLFSGVLGMDVRAGRAAPPRVWRRALVALVVVTAAIEAAFAVAGARGLFMAMSFKSTSLVSFLAAWFALMAAATGGDARRDDASAGRGTGRAGVAGPARPRPAVRFAAAVASGILGFYIAQSLMNGLWHDRCTALMTSLAAHGGAGVAGAIAFGVAFSALFVLVVTMADRFTRQPLLRAMRLLR
ncbi:hypothetical protein [Bifidobacterium parmae]|uniref:Acyltransferase domain-containing protein n=1 Tax=Bifidobacterium parmae TaxID=361854 RepID=A0A2N5J667_9BIFI|nr:hypothetical protein [Bifidobacterium parmae]PLS29677.1 acyltransferase domain-containing protein [Bifidobacterium parmae]